MLHAPKTNRPRPLGESAEYIRSVLRTFFEHCFKKVPKGVADEVSLNLVMHALLAQRPLHASDVARWSQPMRRALYEMLAAGIFELRVAPPPLAADFLAGSSPSLLGGALARWVADKRDSPLLYSRAVKRPRGE